jgi:two-component system, sensor histidine kinase
VNAMRALRDVPIKRKLIIINTVTSGVTLLLACLAFMAYELVVFRKSIVDDLASTASILGANSAAALTFNDTASAEQTLRSLQAHSHIVSAALYGGDDKVFARYQRPGATSSLPPRAPHAEGHWFGPDSIELLQRFEVAGEPAGAVYIHGDLTGLHERMQRYAVIVLLVLITACVFAFLLSVKLQTSIAGPISHLAQVVNKVSVEKDYGVRADKLGEDELGALIDGFNAMLQQIQSQDAALQEARDHLENRVRERTRELRQEVQEREHAQTELQAIHTQLIESNARLAETNRQLLDANERAHEKTQEALVASRAKSDFLANMSHEVRTPMNGVIGIAELLLDTRLSAEQRDYAHTILESGRSLLTVLNDVLDFSKIEAGKLDLELTPADPRRLLGDVARLMSIQADAKGLQFSVHVDPAVPEWICADTHRLRQIFINLCGNGVKFTAAGEVTLAAKVISQDAQSVRLRFEVRDSGIGIPAHRIGALFEPFVQADSSSTRRFGGTGLGLSIVKRLAELMGGEIGVESQESVGSTFWFAAPFALASAAARSSSGAEPWDRSAPLGELPRAVANSGPSILLVEDNDVNRMVARRILEGLGYQVDTAVDGREAVEAWRHGKHALILMDCQMPVLDGYAATREIRGKELPGQHIPIVALTAHAMKDDDLKCKQAGMDDYLTKPIVRQLLSDCLERFLG